MAGLWVQQERFIEKVHSKRC